MNIVKISANLPTTGAWHTTVAGLRIPLDPAQQPSTWSLSDAQLAQLRSELGKLGTWWHHAGRTDPSSVAGVFIVSTQVV